MSDATYRTGQAAASGDEPTRVRWEASTLTVEGKALADQLGQEDHMTRVRVRAALAQLGWRRIGRVRPEDADELGAIMRQLITKHRSAL